MKYIKIILKTITSISLLSAIVFLIIYAFSFIIPFPIEKMNEIRQKRCSVEVLDKNNYSLRSFCGKDDSWTFWVPLEKINPNVINALLAVEDRRFYSHIGVDPISIVRAIINNVFKLHRRSGASTLTMQCMRMLDKKPRTWKNKLIESFMALQLEHIYSKKQILEWYLNVAPFGRNFYGIESAARFYFKKTANDLTLSESALLAGIPQCPAYLRPDIYKKRPRLRRNLVLKQMLEVGYITEQEANFAKKEPIFARKNSLNLAAPHFSYLLKSKYKDKFIINSTLDLRIQQIAKSALNAHLESFNNIKNAAIVVIENKTGAVRAMIGSNNFLSNKNSNKINSAVTVRSPGSTLKPFVYALAFEKYNILPSDIISDTQVNYNGYTPQNYDKKFHGNVSIREALVESYNIPAVRMLKKCGIENFKSLLLSLGIKTLTKPALYYGLPLILGSGSVNLLELTSAFTIFPNKGIYKPYIFLQNENKVENRIISAASAYLITDILKDTSRDLGAGNLKLKKNKIEIAWKTGTSFGFHDAWTIAYDNQFTLGVWLGNLNNHPSKELVGIKAVAPLAIQIIKQITDSAYPANFEIPADIAEYEICATSGKIAGAYCKVRKIIKGNKNANYATCDVHKIIYTYTQTTTKSGDKIVKNKEKIIEDWGTKSFFRKNTSEIKTSHDLKILSPAGNKYILTDRNKEHQKLKLKVKSNSENIYWFINNKFFAKINPKDAIFWKLKIGEFNISCIDDFGNKKTINIAVR